MKVWNAMKPKAGVVTLASAFDLYLADKTALADKTRENYRYNFNRYLGDWKDRSLQNIGEDRPGVRSLQRQIRREYGPATSNQVVHLLSAVYKWQRKVDPTLPEPPTVAVEVDSIPARDWALSAEELLKWWTAVKALGPIKRMWWATILLTGARRGSVEALRWTDVDFDRKIIAFRTAKGNRTYSIPISDKLAELLVTYRDSGDVPPSQWVFPSNVRDGAHIVCPRAWFRSTTYGIPTGPCSPDFRQQTIRRDCYWDTRRAGM